jgi:hypothetical protein
VSCCGCTTALVKRSRWTSGGASGDVAESIPSPKDGKMVGSGWGKAKKMDDDDDKGDSDHDHDSDCDRYNDSDSDSDRDSDDNHDDYSDDDSKHRRKRHEALQGGRRILAVSTMTSCLK